MEKLNNYEDLYSNCDNSIWLRSCIKETLHPIHGKSKGLIPKWLSGSLLRNGPGCTKIGETEFKHLFDCSALLHRFEFKEGNVTYQCKFLESNTYKKNHAAQRIVVTEFGTKACPDPCKTIFNRFANIFKWEMEQTDNAMISIYPFGDEYYSLTEYPVMIRIDPKTLETLNIVEISSKTGIVHHSAHPILDINGDVYNLATIPKCDGIYYCVVRFPGRDPKSGIRYSKLNQMFDQLHVVASIRSRWFLHPSYMHTFGMTEHYFIVVEQPLSVSVLTALVKKFKGEPLSSALKWFPDYPTLIHLVSRTDGSTIFTYETDVFFYLHIINQYEENNNVVIDICCYRDPNMINCMYIEALKNLNKNPNYAAMFRSRPLRFILPLKKSSDNSQLEQRLIISPEILCNFGCETPRINDKNMGRKYRYFYAISSDVDAQNPGTLIKVDISSKTCVTWCEDNVYPSEPIFVPTPNAQEEDDGVILSSILWGGSEQEHRTGVVVLNAKTFKELGRVIFDTESPVPKCLHGWYANFP
ncbi:carotenoid isomerooxygenase [Daktulosphaira vitifoliae]|uniref:carotenoid isomerooxygenase n=1 Tax=Daktulosphaira vitifoliae TaxID=58002 RepID=UPI0021AA9DCD|nr:carotenoid isomerooxygenase [Daktulosphaira vitifoliae]XP_050520886.1 carotenoid isomerooxygenase [Daktulosphaira vitifoliae]